MHLVCNFEKEIGRKLSNNSSKVLELVSSLLGGSGKYRDAWNASFPNKKKMWSRQVGVRFGQASENSFSVLTNVDLLLEFLASKQDDSDVLHLLRIFKLEQNFVLAELAALASCWYWLLERAWCKLRIEDLYNSVTVIDNLVGCSKEVIRSENKEEAFISPITNNFVEVGVDRAENEKSACLKEIVNGFVDDTRYIYNVTVTAMLTKGLGYVEPIRNSWEIDDLTPDQQGLTINNQERGQSRTSILSKLDSFW